MEVYVAGARFSSSSRRSPKQNAQHISRHAGRSVLATSYSRTACRRTTIGAAAFHFRVRNGNGWCHCVIVTRVRNRTGISLLSQRRRREAESLGTRAIEVNRPYLNRISKELSTFSSQPSTD